MTFWDHLQELRVRLVRIIITIAVAFGVTYFFRFRLWDWVQLPFLKAMSQQLGKPISELQPWAFTSLTEPFFSLMRLSLWAAAFLAAPFVFYQVWAFIRPGLYEKERRLALPFVFFTSACFIGGVAFAYRFAFQILGDILFQEAQRANLRPNLHIDGYLDIFLSTVLITGVMFELPVLFYFLARFRVVTAGWMLKYWRHATMVIIVVSAFFTPGDVIVTTVFFAVVLMVLYLVSVAVAWIAEPKAKA